ncbi:MAG: response regulator, partial [Gammaproteobacteria bacterium]|nr:response regulator [Gammaproteobacteria bacterium]
MQDAEKHTVLIVDDDAHNLSMLAALLKPLYKVRAATSGEKALRIANEADPPDLILLDVMMPGMDGFETCRRIRREKSIAEVPILFLTALDDRQSLLNGLDAGADDFITKPPDRYELRARLLSITRLNRYRKLHEERLNLEKTHQQLLDAYDKT